MTRVIAGWEPGPIRPTTEPGTIDIWRVDLSGSLDEALEFLVPAEAARVPTYLRPADALQFARSRAAVRQILGRYLGIAARDVVFERALGGKPGVAGAPFGYNLTHSHVLALIGVGPFELGVDVEWIRPAPMAAGVAAGIVSDAGPIRPDEVPSAERDWQFFRAWTRTEAALKATGEGLSAIDRNPASWIRSLSGPEARTVDGRPIDVVDLPVGIDYAAALATIGRGPDSVRCWVFASAANTNQQVALGSIAE